MATGILLAARGAGSAPGQPNGAGTSLAPTTRNDHPTSAASPMTTSTARRLFTPVRDIRRQRASRGDGRRALHGPQREWSSNTALDVMAPRDTSSWLSSRARPAALGRWWPALLLLALGWVAWLNAPSACALEESTWRDADAQLTRLMIRAHRPPAFSSRPAALSAAVHVAAREGNAEALEQQGFALQSAGAANELLRAKKELEGALTELRMCRQQSGTKRTAGGAGTF